MKQYKMLTKEFLAEYTDTLRKIRNLTQDEMSERLLLATKWLYPEVAKHYATTWKCVERNIRTAVHAVWNTNPELLKALARHPLPQKPKASKFLSILALHFSLESAA